MKLKRAKAYRKLMHQYAIQFGFREPYQVLLDSTILEDAYRTKTDLLTRLESVLQGKVKPMITQCSIRHLYNAKPKNDALINQAKTYERRRCGHHELENPLSNEECLAAVIDPKDSLTNKHRYVVASDDPKTRARLRQKQGVPLVYINKSVMIMEPMNTATEDQIEREERSKFRAGLKGQRNPAPLQKRKRDDEEGAEGDDIEGMKEEKQQKKKKRKGPKQPNPLSMKKAKTEAPSGGNATKPKPTEPKSPRPAAADSTEAATAEGEGAGHRKRKRKHKPKGDGDAAANVDGEAAAA